ncbi:MAG: tRNA threonylcarbamoyladenosine dehydratase [Paludibacteraceae bacterium]|nr:tRNA threonylcarbamoyladenosine dehydratase [Paludibacteraceae bacterium]
MFTRTQQLIGSEGLARLRSARVILFGVGGVGGWCAEALVRSGIQHLTIVDFDVVDRTNINRQVVATSANIGLPKVEEMRKRLLTINPDADIVAVNQRFTAETTLIFPLSTFNYIIDAIDSVKDKAELILAATQTDAHFFSSMGAARKLDAGKIRVSEFRKVEGCPLARALRQRFKQMQRFPERKFTCVWSPEIIADSGTMAHIVGSFGMRLAGEVIAACIDE